MLGHDLVVKFCHFGASYLSSDFICFPSRSALIGVRESKKVVVVAVTDVSASFSDTEIT